MKKVLPALMKKNNVTELLNISRKDMLENEQMLSTFPDCHFQPVEPRRHRLYRFHHRTERTGTAHLVISRRIGDLSEKFNIMSRESVATARDEARPLLAILAGMPSVNPCFN
jgi:hypothetical protein